VIEVKLLVQQLMKASRRRNGTENTHDLLKMEGAGFIETSAATTKHNLSPQNVTCTYFLCFPLHCLHIHTVIAA
jgi:hypothetical protein